MTYRLVYHRLARKELVEAVKWYEEKSAGRGEKFMRFIIAKLAYLQENGERYPVTKGYFREFFVDSYPFIIVFRLNKRKKVLFIAAVFHTSRNPANKYRR